MQMSIQMDKDVLSQDLLQVLGPDSWKLTPATFGHYTSGGKWVAAEHLLYISSIIAARIAEGNGRLIVSMPPRHGKSELMSVVTPQWFMEKYPDRHVILTSHTAELSTNFSRRVRDELRDKHRAGLLSVELRSDASKMAHFITTRGGSLFSAGVGGPITGRGAHLLIVDDFIKTAEEAESPTIRQKINDWFKSVALTRLEPGGTCIILATRWHKFDLIGELLGEQDDEVRMLGYESVDALSPEEKAELGEVMEQWEYITLPALATPQDPLGRQEGEALWPWRYNQKFLERRKRRLGRYFWSSLYQQTPISRSEWLLDGDKIRYVKAPPRHDNMQWARAWDFAAEEEHGADYTASALFGVDLTTDEIYLAEVTRHQLTPSGVQELVKMTAATDAQKYGTVEIVLEQEPGSAGKAVVDAYKRQHLRGYYVTIERPTGPKHIRANPFYSALEDGRIIIVRGIWNKPLWDELELFPGGEHDDQVDACAYAYNRLCGPRPLGPSWVQGSPGEFRVPDAAASHVIVGPTWH